MTLWPVVPVCDAQKEDVRPEDLIEDGLFRRCSIYRGGGGYDKFASIYRNRHPETDKNISLSEQFVVQLKGCPLSCPWCYVTPEGVHGKARQIPTEHLLSSFDKSGLDVFHLMGGAPALYIQGWPEILAAVSDGKVFHSDFLLTESLYSPEVLGILQKYKNSLYAVSIKGFWQDTYRKTTGTEINLPLMKENLRRLKDWRIPYYITFTGMLQREIDEFKMYFSDIADFEDSFSIPIKHYKALDFRKK